MLDIGAVTGVLQEINVDAETVRSIVEILDLGIDILDGEMQPVDAGVFGASYRGGELGRHTEIAHRKITEAMNDMMIGLGRYRNGLERYADEALEVDDNVTVAATRLRAELDAAAGCLAKPDLTDDPVCAAPAEDA